MAKELNKDKVKDLIGDVKFLTDGSEVMIEQLSACVQDLSLKISHDNFGTVAGKDSILRGMINNISALKKLSDESALLLEIFKILAK